MPWVAETPVEDLFAFDLQVFDANIFSSQDSWTAEASL